MAWLNEPERDPRLKDALARREPAPDPLGERQLVDRIMRDARPVLAARRAPARSWWDQVAAWSRFAVPAAAGVGLVAALVLASEYGTISPEWASDSVTVSETVLSAATLPAGEVQVEDQLVAPVSDEWLISGAFASAASGTNGK
ncbi:MAG: hypothetical protein U0133_07125 [Gemmatimonadales bacterium]